jgi:formylglycine-generating enzyme required for sulfatase activity
MILFAGGRFRSAARVGPMADTVAYHSVRPFLLDVAEVTVAQYDACVRAGVCTPAWDAVHWTDLGDEDRSAWSPYCNRDRADRAHHPVNCVDWHQAVAYCAGLGKRLPTEEEWEWAARGEARGTRYPWGAAAPSGQLCWNGNGRAAAARRGTCGVGEHAASDSPSGVKGLAGNVAEWTATHALYGADYRGHFGAPGRVIRGGSWHDTSAEAVSAAARQVDVPARRDPTVGFRCAKSR